MVRLYLSYIKAEEAYRRQDRLLASCSTTVSPNDHALSPHTGQGANLAHPCRAGWWFACAVVSPPAWHCYPGEVGTPFQGTPTLGNEKGWMSSELGRW
jgi:hypothetical protein